MESTFGKSDRESMMSLLAALHQQEERTTGMESAEEEHDERDADNEEMEPEYSLGRELNIGSYSILS